jgi:hypothetical protein
MKGVGLVSASIVALAAAGALAWSRAAPSTTAHPARVASSAALPADEAEVSIVAPRPVSVPFAAPSPARLAASPGKPPESKQPHRMIFNDVPEAEIPMHVQTLFEAERTDPRWARDVKWSLVDKLDQVKLPGARVDSVECHSSTCKVTTDFPDRAAQRAYFAKAYIGTAAAIASLGMPLYAHLTNTPDGVKSEVYLYKDPW